MIHDTYNEVEGWVYCGYILNKGGNKYGYSSEKPCKSYEI